MARKKKQSDAPPGMGWMITFSDCMTLLLCFFVLLLTFSSFEEIKFETLAGAFRSMSHDWFEPTPEYPKDSLIESKRPNENRQGPRIQTDNPQTEQPPIDPVEELDISIYQDRTVITLPGKPFFWGQGAALSESGKEYLRLLGDLLRRMDCRVVIGVESGMGNRRLGLQRSWSVLRQLVTVEGIARSRLSLSAVAPSARAKFPGRDILTITLMNVQIENR
jgi:chemotaxis protein MotB